MQVHTNGLDKGLVILRTYHSSDKIWTSGDFLTAIRSRTQTQPGNYFYEAFSSDGFKGGTCLPSCGPIKIHIRQ